MQLKEEAVFTLKFDGKPVINELGELEQKLNDVKEAQKSVERGTKEWADNKTQIKELEASIKQVREEMGVSGLTVRQLEGYYRELNREIKNLTPGTDAYIQKSGQLQEVNQALATHRQTIRGVGDEIEKQPSLWERAKASVVAFFTVASLLEGGRMLINYFIDSVKEFRAFQSAAQELSAVTGATGKDLDYLKAQAKEVGPAFGKTGAEMLEAYKLMASAKPELLAQKELLAETTKAALTLADAGKIDLATATKVTAESLNQFGQAASQANRFINVIAAGAKEGAAEIGEMGMSLKASGTVAKAAGLSFEQTNATLQSMSTIALKGEQAGTMLRNVLVKLQTGADETNPKIVGMEKALDNLAKQNLSTAEMAKLFGTENLVAAQHIVTHRAEIAALTQKLTGTQEAYKQAATNNASFDHELAKTKATLNSISVDLVGVFVPAMTKGLQGVVALANGIRAVPEFLSENKTAFAALGLAILAFNGHLIVATATSIAHAAQEKARLVWTNSATAAQWLLNTALTANPIGAVIAGVALLVAGFATLYNHSTTVRAGIAGLFSALKVAAGQLVLFWQAITALNFTQAAKIMADGGAKIAAGFTQGYEAEIKKGQPKQLTNHSAHVGKLTTISAKGGQDAATAEVAEHGKGLSKKEQAAQKHRDLETKKAADAAQKEAQEAVRATNEGLKHIETLRIESIKNDLEREKAKIRAKRDAEVEAMMASKASAEVKAVWEKALNEQMIRDIAKAETDHRQKHEKEEAETARRVLDLKIKLSGDEKADKLQKLEDVASAQRAQIQKDISDETQKAQLLKQVNDNLIRDKEKVEQDFRRKKQQEETALQNTLYQATVSDANARLALAGTNAQAIYDAKKMRLDAEYQFNKQKLEREAAEEKAKNQDLIQDHDKRAAADKAIDDRLKSELKSNDVKYETDKTTLTAEKTEARKKNQQEYFTAIKALMDGDFKAFSDILTKKLAGENKQLTESQKKQIDTIDTVGQYTVMATQALQKLSQLKLDKELANIKKEKDSQLTAWDEKYKKGLIGKDEYEAGVDQINKEADQKNKAAQLAAFKRQQGLDIAMAVINGAQAALKSLAMFGWPLGLIGVAGAVAATAIQVALIKRQQPPSMAQGGKIQNAGVPDGPGHGTRYGESGLSITRRDTGEEVAEMEGGEPIMVLSRNTYKNNRNLVDNLLHSSLHRNGAPVMLRGGLFGADGGSYGDYRSSDRLANGGLRRFDNGGWMDDINNSDSGGAGSSERASSGGSTGGGGDSGISSGGEGAGNLQGQIDQSQKTQEEIAKNTLVASTALEKVVTTLGLVQQQIRLESDAQQTAWMNQLTSLRTEVKTGLSTLQASSSLHMLILQQAIHTDLTALQSTMKVEFPSLGKDMITELSALRSSFSLNLMLLRLGLSLDLTGLKEVTRTGLDDLRKTTHEDLTTLQKLLHDDLDTLQDKVHTDLDSLKFAQALQYMALRTDTKQHFTTLQTILQTELETLRRATHSDLGNLADSNKTELRSVAGILTQTKSEQGYQSGLLQRIAAKDLSVSVQTFVNVFNQIDVVADKSNLK
jgi:TP901 family phage tail tape measure protein